MRPESSTRSACRETQKFEKIARSAQTTTEQLAVALAAIPNADLRQEGAVLCPALSVRLTQCMRIIIPIAREIAVRTREQSQPAQSPASPKIGRERVQATIDGTRRVRLTTLVSGQEATAHGVLSQRHQRVPPGVIQQHEAPRLAYQIDRSSWHPIDDLRRVEPRRLHQTPQIHVSHGHAQITAAVAAARAAKTEMAEAARHGRGGCPRSARGAATHRERGPKSPVAVLPLSRRDWGAMLSAEARGPAYRIVTDRLVIRCWEPSDAMSLKLAIDGSLPHLRRWLPWAASEPTPLDQKVAWLRKSRGEFDLGLDYSFGVFSADDSEVIGGAGLHLRQGLNVREIGYWVASAQCRKGYATEVTRALIRVGFEVDAAARIEIRVWPENRHSQRIPQNLGFVSEGTLRGISRDADGRPCDVQVFSLLREDYECSPLPDQPLRALDVAGQELL